MTVRRRSDPSEAPGLPPGVSSAYASVHAGQRNNEIIRKAAQKPLFPDEMEGFSFDRIERNPQGGLSLTVNNTIDGWVHRAQATLNIKDGKLSMTVDEPPGKPTTRPLDDHSAESKSFRAMLSTFAENAPKGNPADDRLLQELRHALNPNASYAQSRGWSGTSGWDGP
jgi:hypothetical protein